jgi:hypothetical protein
MKYVNTEEVDMDILVGLSVAFAIPVGTNIILS